MAWLPFAIQGGEALLVGLIAFGGTYQATSDYTAAIAAAIAAMGGKVLPSQVVKTSATTP